MPWTPLVPLPGTAARLYPKRQVLESLFPHLQVSVFLQSCVEKARNCSRGHNVTSLTGGGRDLAGQEDPSTGFEQASTLLTAF